VRWLDKLGFDEATQRALLLPILGRPQAYPSEVLAEVCNSLGKPDKRWAVAPSFVRCGVTARLPRFSPLPPKRASACW